MTSGKRPPHAPNFKALMNAKVGFNPGSQNIWCCNIHTDNEPLCVGELTADGHVLAYPVEGTCKMDVCITICVQFCCSNCEGIVPVQVHMHELSFVSVLQATPVQNLKLYKARRITVPTGWPRLTVSVTAMAGR